MLTPNFDSSSHMAHFCLGTLWVLFVYVHFFVFCVFLFDAAVALCVCVLGLHFASFLRPNCGFCKLKCALSCV